jgi:uncharacterized repeat protein (TIGR03803 family)
MNNMIQDEPAIRKTPRRPLGAVLALAGALFSGVIAAPPAQAQTYSVLYSFQCAPNDGSDPASALTLDTAGNLYGTTGLGGSSNLGTVFKLSPDGAETVLYSFTGGLDGGIPFGKLLLDAAGNLYGTAVVGGANKGGVAFKLTPEGTETVLHNFGAGSDGSGPSGGFIRGGDGVLYGITENGGSFGFGTVYSITGHGKETVLYSFDEKPSDGRYPSGALVQDAAGNLYGTSTEGGADGFGIVFKLAPNGTETVLYSFTGERDGRYPAAPLMQDAAGNLYGVTSEGGALLCGGGSGCGVVFALSPAGEESLLHIFAGPPSDGWQPASGVYRSNAGSLLGTTSIGGTAGSGVVYGINAAGKERILHDFAGPPDDGASPNGNLIRDSAGNFYGATAGGGSGAAPNGQGCGTVFKLQP